jgi:hypothetical protein
MPYQAPNKPSTIMYIDPDEQVLIARQEAEALEFAPTPHNYITQEEALELQAKYARYLNQ